MVNQTLNTFRRELAEKLIAVRLYLGYSQMKLAEELKIISQSSIHNYESGKYNVNPLYLFALSGLARVTVDDLISLNTRELIKKIG